MDKSEGKGTFANNLRRMLRDRFYYFDDKHDKKQLSTLPQTSYINRLLIKELLNDKKENQQLFKNALFKMYDKMIKFEINKRTSRFTRNFNKAEIAEIIGDQNDNYNSSNDVDDNVDVDADVNVTTIEIKENIENKENKEMDTMITMPARQTKLVGSSKSFGKHNILLDAKENVAITKEHSMAMYFAQLNCKTDNVSKYEWYICVILFQVGIFWDLSLKTIKTGDIGKILNEKTDESYKLILKYFENEMIDILCVNDTYSTLYHLSILCNEDLLFDLLLEISRDCEIFTDIANKVT